MRSRLFVVCASLWLCGCLMPIQGSASERAIIVYHHAYPSAGGDAVGAIRRSAPTELAMDDAIVLARENSARIAELAARVEAAKAAVDAKKRYQNPELRIAQLKLDDVLAGNGEVRPSLRFRPNRPGEQNAEIAEARAAVDSASAELAGAERALASNVRFLFEDVLLMDAEIKAVDAVAEARRALATQMKTRLDAASTTALEASMAELSAVDAEQDGAELAGRRALALGKLLDTIGLDPTRPIKILGNAAIVWPPAKLPTEKTLVEEAIHRDMRIALASSRMDVENARIAIERAKQIPWFSFIELGYGFGPKTTPGLGFTLQAGIDLPIFDTNRRGVRAKEAALMAEQRGLTAEVERVVNEVRLRLREVESAEALVTNYEAKAVPIAERSAIASKKALESGGIDLIRALTVDERRVVVELRLLQLKRRYRVSLAELWRVVGGVLPSPG